MKSLSRLALAAALSEDRKFKRTFLLPEDKKFKRRIGNSNALFCSQRPSGKALDHPLNRPLGLFAAR